MKASSYADGSLVNEPVEKGQKEVDRMDQPFASGDWHVTEGKEEEFVERWTEFLQWTRETQPSLVTVSLLRDEGDPTHFVSFAEWTHAADRDAWKESPGFMERFGACRALCSDMKGSNYSRQLSL